MTTNIIVIVTVLVDIVLGEILLAIYKRAWAKGKLTGDVLPTMFLGWGVVVLVSCLALCYLVLKS